MTDYLSLISKLLNKPELLAQVSKKAANFKNASISSEDMAQFTDKPTIEQLESIVKDKGEFAELIEPMMTIAQAKLQDAEIIWRKVVQETRKHNKTYAAAEDIKQKLINRIKKQFKDKNDEQAADILEYVIQMMQRHSAINMTFPSSILQDDVLKKHRVITQFERDTKGGDYLKQRDEAEKKVVEHLSPDLKKRFYENGVSRPRYARLQLFSADDLPSVQSGYGDSFLLLNEKIKLQSTFTLGDTIIRSSQNLTLATIESLELLLHQAYDYTFKSIVNWALYGSFADVPSYIETQMPSIDVLDPNHVSNIFVHGSRLPLQEIQKGFKDLEIQISDKQTISETRDKFFRLIQTKPSDLEAIKKLIKEYPFLIKLRNEENLSAIEIAAKGCDLSVFKLIINESMGINPDNLGSQELTVYDFTMLKKAFKIAADHKNGEVLGFLKEEFLPVIFSLPLRALEQQDMYGKSVADYLDQENKDLIINHTKDCKKLSNALGRIFREKGLDDSLKIITNALEKYQTKEQIFAKIRNAYEVYRTEKESLKKRSVIASLVDDIKSFFGYGTFGKFVEGVTGAVGSQKECFGNVQSVSAKIEEQQLTHEKKLRSHSQAPHTKTLL